MGLQSGLQKCIEVSQNLNFDAQVKQFIYACQDKALRKSVLKTFRYHPLLKIHDIARAVYLLIALEEGEDLGLNFLNMQQHGSGAVELFSRGGFLWRGLPYPAEHAEFGLLILQISEFYEEIRACVSKIGSFQQAMFDHQGVVFPSLWSQEYSRPLKEKTGLSQSFLLQLGIQILPEYDLMDPALGFWMQRTRSSSAFVAASGCQSSLGAYYSGDVGVIAYGPCSGDISDCCYFGGCGVAKEFYCQKSSEITEISFLSSTGIPHPRNTRFSYIQDSYADVPLSCHITVSDKQCRVDAIFDKKTPATTFSIFCKGNSCQVIDGPRLRSYSLDSYKGPTNDITILGQNDIMNISCVGTYMEIFALQGKEKFWNADFLINIPPKEDRVTLIFEKTTP
ncbi:hypothetical protein C10C_0379 [Chlamydia serpentis]|uniref:Uncharacterized protein n=1 Tax=Chlamydia serpentis TaxID=1967782 RepID=A0A2R8FAU7_9CHLA|nr:hypothetical protein [Chlamydia serpentis]SPN73549.1 hypothetical protein C10C_0379 [Chlamydia serpentis]